MVVNMSVSVYTFGTTVAQAEVQLEMMRHDITDSLVSEHSQRQPSVALPTDFCLANLPVLGRCYIFQPCVPSKTRQFSYIVDSFEQAATKRPYCRSATVPLDNSTRDYPKRRMTGLQAAILMLSFFGTATAFSATVSHIIERAKAGQIPINLTES